VVTPVELAPSSSSSTARESAGSAPPAQALIAAAERERDRALRWSATAAPAHRGRAQPRRVNPLTPCVQRLRGRAAWPGALQVSANVGVSVSECDSPLNHRPIEYATGTSVVYRFAEGTGQHVGTLVSMAATMLRGPLMFRL
jgi:hypothetical protein